jgi:ribosomal protein S3
MITALQSAKIEIAGQLTNARAHLMRSISSIVWRHHERDDIDEMIATIDALISRIIPNEPLE